MFSALTDIRQKIHLNFSSALKHLFTSVVPVNVAHNTETLKPTILTKKRRAEAKQDVESSSKELTLVIKIKMLLRGF